MTALADRDVLKDRRTNAEALANSAQTPLGASDPHAGDRLRVDRYVLDLRRGCLLADEREVALRPKTFELLLYLASHPGRLVSKDELLAAVWPGVFVCDDSLVQCVTELRRALADRGQTLIKTLPRRGYRFDAMPVVEEARARPPGSATARLAWAIGILVLAALIGVGIWWALSDRSRAPPLSIAVMPFVDLGAGAERGDLIESLAYDLTTDLSRLPDLLVIAYATARTFKGTDRDAREVGLELNVRYLLDGNLYRSGDQLRINVQLIDTASGASVWSNRFERRRDELPGWRDEVIGRIANALNFRLTAL
jgi:TolB-like protein/DNA-binding winged helix-turn-helix (wHTH) protein